MWSIVYFVTCLIHSWIVWSVTDRAITDVRAWLWILVPGIAYACGAKIHGRGPEG